MSLTTVLLALLSMGLAAAAASGPAAEAHAVLSAHESSLQGAPQATRLEVAVADERGGPRLSVVEEAARGVMPPPLWDTFFHEHPDTLVTTNRHSKTSAEPEAGAGFLELLAPYYLPDVQNVSPECRRDVEALSNGFTSGKLWAQRVVDSWGKFSDGVIVGNLWTPGLLDECLRTTVDSLDPEAHFRGRYCSFSIGTKTNTTSSQQLLWEEGEVEYGEDEEDEYPEEVEGEEEYGEDEEDEYAEEVEGEVKERKVMQPNLRMANVKGFLQVAAPYNLLATCIPSTCTKEEYRQSLVEQLKERNLELSLLECQTKDLPTMQYNAADIIMIVTLTILGVMVLVGTVADVWITITKNERLAGGPLRYFLVFSFYTNLFKIFHINTNDSAEVISCLHGIRVLTMCWVVMGHSYLISVVLSANEGVLGEMVEEHPYIYQIVLNAFPSVDTFFMMSGLLVAYNLTKEVKRTSRFNIPLYYIHRFIRLAPPIMLLCGFFAVFPPLFVQGSLSPMLVQKANMVDECLRHWWRDSFFLTNIFAGQEDGGSCLPVCWYTAVEFQLYIVTPFMFLPLLYRRRPGLVVLGVFILASVAVPMAITGANQLPPATVMDLRPEISGLVDKLVYTKPWCRASPYLVGLALGYYLRVVDKEKVQLKWWQAALGWIVALVIMSAVVFGLKDYNTLTGVPHEYNAAESILYSGLHRLAWGVALAWLVFACHMGYGGPANSLLAHPFWQPLSRLTYTTFLVALNVQSLYYIYYARLPSYFTPFYKVTETAGILLVSGCGAVLLSLLAESPVLGLEKLLLGKGRKRPEPPRSRTSSASSLNTASTPTHVTPSQSSFAEASSTDQLYNVTSSKP